MAKSLFSNEGLHILCDGQYGSTGKGALAAWLAEQSIAEGFVWDGVITNAGPNSGHTFYHGSEKHVLKQLPTFAVYAFLHGEMTPAYISAGAIVDPEILRREAEKYYPMRIVVHPNAAVITEQDVETEHSGTVAMVAGTRSGTGAALARKILRDPGAVFSAHFGRENFPNNISVGDIPRTFARYFMEVSQGFSLGLNQMFYPKCTSRECTPAQAVSDASLSPRRISRVYTSFRTFPIRVGNVDGHSSGDWYPDQDETTWEALGQMPELTTVTQRERRVATFSDEQFMDALEVTDPDFVFVNFLNYLAPGEQLEFLRKIDCLRHENLTTSLWDVIAGYGPKVADILRVGEIE